MKTILIFALLMMAAALFAQEGPRTSRKDFFLGHVDLSIPELLSLIHI